MLIDVLKALPHMCKSPNNATSQPLERFSWLPENLAPIHADFSRRIVCLPDENSWQATPVPHLLTRILDYIPGQPDRLTALFRLNDSAAEAVLSTAGVEILLQQGELEDEVNAWPAGLYLRVPRRQPNDAAALSDSLRLCRPPDAGKEQANVAAELYLATGQFAHSDTEIRRINTLDESRWLPGPIDATEVMPLHGHGSSNAMLVRWLQPAEFRPRLDPLGEEVLVLSGTLSDADGDYPAGSWLRNPVPSWQSWAGNSGTVIFYKSGHFHRSAELQSAAYSDAQSDA